MSIPHRAVLLLLVAALLAGCAATPGAPAAAPPTPLPTESPWYTGTPVPLVAPLTPACLGGGATAPQLSQVQYGINNFLFATDRERALALTTIAGFGWVRQQIHWRDLEGEQGQFVWRPLDEIVSAARARNLDIMLSVVRSPAWARADGGDGLPDNPDDLARFLRAVAERYRGRVAAYQVWNEPNLAHEGGGAPIAPADYLAALQASYAAIKAADPCALVVSAALAGTNDPDPAVASEDIPFWEALYALDAGAFIGAADIVGMHTGAGANPPGARWPPDAPATSHQYFRHMERARAVMERHGDPRQVWLTEYGWTVTEAVGAPPPVTQAQQASYLVDALWWVRQRMPWVSGVFVWNLNFSVIAPPDDEKTTYSVLDPDWNIRPAFLALQNNVPALRAVDRPLRIPDDVPLTLRWVFPARGALRSPPLVSADGHVLAVSDPGTLSTVGPDGFLAWHYDAAGTVTSAPARAPDGTLFVGDTGSLLTAIGPDGAPRWQVRLRSPLRGSPRYQVAVADQPARLLAVTQVGEVLAFDPADGRTLWARDLEGETTPPALSSDDTLLLAHADGTLRKLDARDGALVWSVPTGGEVWSAPVPDGSGGALLATVAGRLLAVDAQGSVRWQTELGAPVEAAPLPGQAGGIYVALRNGRLAALDAATGARRWQATTGPNDLRAAPAQGNDGTLYIGTEDERLLAFAPDTGALRWALPLRGVPRAPLATGADGTLYVPTTGGLLYALRPGP